MPAKIQDQVLVACPHCGHQQPEARTGFSTVCRECGRHFRIQEALNPVSKGAGRAPRQRRITCFECGAELDVPASAESTMCKRCSHYLDLHNYHINTAVSKNFKTKGKFCHRAERLRLQHRDHRRRGGHPWKISRQTDGGRIIDRLFRGRHQGQLEGRAPDHSRRQSFSLAGTHPGRLRGNRRRTGRRLCKPPERSR